MTKQMAPYLGTVALMAQIFVFPGCGGSNAPSTVDIMTGAAGTPSTTGAAGTTGTAGTPATSGAAGAAAAGTTGAAGSATSTGAAGTMGAGGGAYSPQCALVPLTAAGVAPTKAGACVAADTQLCYKTCGPQSSGFKSETCTNGAYVEQSGCSFPMGVDYSCYKVPTAIDATCPATAPQASQPCTVKTCTPCNVGGNYLDSTGASKPGFCVCPAAGASGTSKWSCASTTAWPCPNNQGC